MDLDFLYFILALCPLFLIVGYFEYRKTKLLHLERMAAIERGLPPIGAYDGRPLAPWNYFRRGTLWLLPGLGLSLFTWLIAGDPTSGWTIVGILMACVGLAYLLAYYVEGRQRG